LCCGVKRGPMTIEREVSIANRNGLHARPAHLFVQTANSYAARLQVRRTDSEERVDGKSIMGMMMLAAESGAELELVAEGPDAGPLLRDPAAKRHPAVMTFQPGNHAVRTERWRYIRYRDGSEELRSSCAHVLNVRSKIENPRFHHIERQRNVRFA